MSRKKTKPVSELLKFIYDEADHIVAVLSDLKSSPIVGSIERSNRKIARDYLSMALADAKVIQKHAKQAMSHETQELHRP